MVVVPERQNAVIGKELYLNGSIRNGATVEVWGRVDGEIIARHVVVHPGARVVGRVDAEQASVDGYLDGRVRVRNLISIGGSGEVVGDVRYGSLQLASGGLLSAEVRNIPPELSGDFTMTVRQGRTARVTVADLSATDPEDADATLTYSVSGETHGFVALAGAPDAPVTHFTQGDINDGRVLFVHRASGSEPASFEVVVSDSQGATAGAPRRVNVAVIAGF